MSSDELHALADQVARRALEGGVTVAAAESLTSGLLLSTLGRGERAADWFRGGVVAYSTRVKHSLLDVSPGPVISAKCAQEMAFSAARLLQSSVAVATTGAGGPDAEEGQQPGTVYLGWYSAAGSGSELHLFDGSPAKVVEQTVIAALGLFLQLLD